MKLTPPCFSWLLCKIGIHGPKLFGHGLGVSSPRNCSIGPGHRRCTHCGAEWAAYEEITGLPVRVVGWERIKPDTAKLSA
jgi:hypothetical protein